MWPWLVLLLLISAEAVGIGWWLRKENYNVMFNGWAALIYLSILEADFVAAWLVSMLNRPGGTFGTSAFAVFGLILVVVVSLLTLFFRWVVRHDIHDIPK